MNKYYSSTEIRARDPYHGPDIRLKSDALDQWFPTFWVLSPGAGSQWLSSIHGVFLRNRLYLGHTGVTSFCVQFLKTGRWLLREA